ncbi:hypothetical protein V8E54_004737 [Elaphomyces granulatus]
MPRLDEYPCRPRKTPVHDDNDGNAAFRCPNLPGMEDVLVTLKTGVIEAREKIPVQIQTSLQCEEIAGVQSYDVLRTIKKQIMEQNPDFEIYNRVQELGRDGLNSTDFPIAFLPMVDKARQVRPDAKWYVFMEADTYLIWPNLDSKKPRYFGNPVQISDAIFAHGCSGIVLSSLAMQLVSDRYASYIEEINSFTAEQWAGDCVLGKVLADVGVPLFWSWPMLQGGMPWDFDCFGDAFRKKTWCYPAISFHHANATEVEQMWQFNQEWFRNENRLHLHSDVFRDFILLQIMASRDDWDNMSLEKPADGEDSRPSLKCELSNSVKRGGRRQGIRSGWMIDRIIGLMDYYGPCRKPNWLP